MDFTLKSYQVFKLKSYFKNKSLFIVFHCAKLNLNEWVQIEQKLKKLKLKYYKPLNKMTINELEKSVYCHYKFMVNSFILFLSYDCISCFDLAYNLNQLQVNLKPLLIKVSLKLNNQFYSSKQLIKFQQIGYKDNALEFCKVLSQSLKISYVLTKSIKIRNNVI
jgi:hypothetical protein